jgi:hypothetical protein
MQGERERSTDAGEDSLYLASAAELLDARCRAWVRYRDLGSATSRERGGVSTVTSLHALLPSTTARD